MNARRARLWAGSLIGIGMLASGLAGAQGYPSKQVTLVVPFAAGGGTDIVARVFATEMQRTAGQTVIVENKPGGGGVIASEYIVKSGADGHTVCFCSPTVVFLPGIQDPNTAYDPTKVLKPIVHLFDAVALYVARPGFKANSLREVLAEAKANPGAVSFGSIGSGNRATYPVELLANMTGTKFNNVMYKSEQMVVTDVLGDRLDVGYVGTGSSLPHIRAGKLKPLAAIAPARLPALPDVPTAAEILPGYEATVFYGLFVPTATPAASADRLADIALAALKTPAVQDRLRADSYFPTGDKSDRFAARVRSDAALWNKLMK